ncbi:PD-(D/E)XK nuclease family transposase [Thiocystis violascens]|nr:PD-(D/E)XK nuclease family transposase [Thiocystis violascens]
MRDEQGRTLIDHGSIRLFELGKFHVQQVSTETERWLKFLKDGEHLDPARLPDWMQHPIMRHAMSTLNGFSEKERDYHRYQSRQEALRLQRAVQRALDEKRAEADAGRQAKEEALQAKEAERQAKEEALAEVARLQALLSRRNEG